MSGEKTPQLENGYTRIANELLEALARIRIPGQAQQLLNVIIRKTYGYGKKKDRISMSQFKLSTGMGKSAISRAMRKLSTMNIVIFKDNGNGVTYIINKHYQEWKPLSLKITNPKGRPKLKKEPKPLSLKITKEPDPLSLKITPVIFKDNSDLIINTKETLTKETSLKKENQPEKINTAQKSYPPPEKEETDKDKGELKRQISLKIIQLKKNIGKRINPLLNALVNKKATHPELNYVLASLIKYKPNQPKFYALRVLDEKRQQENAARSRETSKAYKKDFTTAADLLKIAAHGGME